MKSFIGALICVCSIGSAVAEDRPILLITPQGVWMSTVTGGVPGPFVAMPYDVIVHRGGVTPVPPVVDPPHVPNPTDPAVAQVAAISKAELKDKNEATSVAAIVNSLSKMGLTGANFKQALEMAIPIADTSLQAGGRLVKWSKSALAVTSDPSKLIAGLSSAFSINASTLETIYAGVKADPGSALPSEALDWAQIIQIIQMILDLLKNLGIV